MRVAATARILAAMLSSVFAGCAQNAYTLHNQNQTLQQQQQALSQRNQELQSRASTLDQDNQELQTLLAQARQESKLASDQLAAVRDQLSSAISQLAQLRDEKQLTEKQTEALVASTRRRSGAMITANNSLNRNLPAVNLPGVEVRADGDVVRIELPASRLFVPGGATLAPSAGVLIDSVASEIVRNYPQQIVGIEGHTDNDTLRGGPGVNQQISVGWAMTVYQHLSSRGQLQPGQLFVVGHGGNHPVVSNATPTGKARNTRVELVVYPESYSGSR